MNVEFEKDFTLGEVHRILNETEGVKVVDDATNAVQIAEYLVKQGLV